MRPHYTDTGLLSCGRVGVNAPTRTRAKIGQGYPLRASERHADTATDGHKPEIEPVSDFLTPPDQRADSDKKTRHEATHAATRPKRADERQGRRRKDTADTLTSQKPPRAAAETVRRQENAERATLRHHTHAPTHHERRRICTHARAQRV